MHDTWTGVPVAGVMKEKSGFTEFFCSGMSGVCAPGGIMLGGCVESCTHLGSTERVLQVYFLYLSDKKRKKIYWEVGMVFVSEKKNKQRGETSPFMKIRYTEE